MVTLGLHLGYTHLYTPLFSRGIMAKKRYVEIPIRFRVGSNRDGIFLIPPANLKRILLGSKAKKRK